MKMGGGENFALQSGRTILPLAAPETSSVYFVRIQMRDFLARWLKMAVR